MDPRTTISLLLLLLLGLCNAHSANDHGADNEILADKSDMEDITTTILRMNNGSSDFLLEGDVLIPRTRNAMKCFNKAYSCLWQKSANGNVEVPFLMSHKYDDTERSTILHALKDMESKTCIRFIPRARQRAYLSIEPRYGHHYIRVWKSEDVKKCYFAGVVERNDTDDEMKQKQPKRGFIQHIQSCASLLGRVGDKQVLSLQRYGCIRHGIIQHELLHALGFYHEHNRSDRDQYVKINWENVNQYFVFNFKTKDTNNLNTPYDYTSIMHYGRTAFGMHGSETIIPIPDTSVPIGQRDSLSDIDIYRINKLYKCWNYIG